MNFYPSLEEIRNISGEYANVPVSLTVEPSELGDIGVPEIYKRLRCVSSNVFVLESAEDKSGHGRYTFIGFDPKLEITCLDSRVKIKSGAEIVLENTAPHEYIRNILRENKSPRIKGLPAFTGGLVGYFSFDFLKYSEKSLKLDAFDEEGFNDADLMLFDKLIVIDNLEEKIILIANAKMADIEPSYAMAVAEIKKMLGLLRDAEKKVELSGRLIGELEPLFTREQYCKIVEKGKKHIFEGDIFQVVLSNRWKAKYEGSLFGIYLALKKTNPSPYMFYFSSDDIEIAGASPETLVKLDGDTLQTFPLAGTRPRGKTEKEDKRLEKELLSDEKELAEHNMLVDLGRNDLGKVCKFGTVSVEKYMNIERFSHVMHISSTVTGKIRSDKDALDALEAVLPAGTLSGAPKLRACEIINELEGNKRGIYGGAIGYLDFCGNIDACIAIRLAYKKNGNVYVRSGGGIVADSVPNNEYEESVNKAKAIMNALKEESKSRRKQ